MFNRAIQPTLSNLELSVMRSKEIPFPPVLIVGPPRSGTTLLYQLLTSRFKVGYISNAHARWYGCPALYERLRRPRIEGHVETFSSYHGGTDGKYGPNECGEFWYRFFPRRPHCVKSISQRDAQRLRSAIAAITSSFQSSVVFKNVCCSGRLLAISEAVPEFLYVHVHRNVVDNAASIMSGRERHSGALNSWWSFEPPEINQLKLLGSEEQCLGQVECTHSCINDARSYIGSDRFFNVTYEALCEDAHKVMDDFQGFLDSWGSGLSVRGQIPNSFARKQSATLTAPRSDSRIRVRTSTEIDQ
jgi:hypothetical protein